MGLFRATAALPPANQQEVIQLRMNRLSRLLAVVAIAATSALACSSGTNSAAPAGPVKLTYFTFSAAPDHLNDLNKIADAFHQKYPNVTIDIQTAAYKDYFTKLQTEVAGNAAPDTFELNYENFVSYTSAGSLLDLSSSINSDKDYKASIYYPRAYQVFENS